MWRMAGLVMLAACGAVSPAGADVVVVDRPFVLQVGQSATWAEGALSLHFEEVLLDSRCPKGEQCVLAGVARIRVRVEGVAQTRQYVELQLPDRPSIPLPGRAESLNLMQLDPYPISGRKTEPGQAMAALVILRATSDR